MIGLILFVVGIFGMLIAFTPSDTIEDMEMRGKENGEI